ncbi:histone H3 [Klebsormidium nitens]|uniref:Histone H3 n=1 Tax=Klebsormidium nitens TaxID=105231 RepID=A0A1Y1INU2_KLENI|nr:histone H3 [Klebsormidium nitens]|eukprot:GAQ92323.1 histone H3 [Klebsormidium nitens]
MRPKLQRGHQAEKVAAPEDEVGNYENSGKAQVPSESEPAIDRLEREEFGLRGAWGPKDYLSYVETLAAQKKWSRENKTEAEAHYQAQFAERVSGEQSPPPVTVQTEEGAPEEVQKERGIMIPEEYQAELDEIARNNAPFEKPFQDSEPDEDDPPKSGHLNAGEDDPDAPTKSELQENLMFMEHARGEEAPAEVEEERREELHSMLGEPVWEVDPAEQHKKHKASIKSFGKISRELVTAGKQPQKKRRSKATRRKPSSVWGVVGGKKPVAWAAVLAGKPEAVEATGQKGSRDAKKRKKVAPTGAIENPAAGEGKQKVAKGGSGKAVVGGRQKASAATTPSRPEKKLRRYKLGTLALREFRKKQKSTDFLIPRSTFARIGPEEGAETEKLPEKRKETKAKQGPGVGAKSSGVRAEMVEGTLEKS